MQHFVFSELVNLEAHYERKKLTLHMTDDFVRNHHPLSHRFALLAVLKLGNVPKQKITLSKLVTKILTSHL